LQQANGHLERALADALEARHAAAAAGRAAAAAEARLRAAFAQAPAAVALTVGSEHRYVLVNARAAALVGRDDLVGRSCAEAFPGPAGQEMATLLDRVYATGAPYAAHDARVVVPRPALAASGAEAPGAEASGAEASDPEATGAEARYFDLVCQPLADADGRVTGILQHAVDVTDRHAAEAAARGAAARAELLQALTAGFSAALTPRRWWRRCWSTACPPSTRSPGSSCSRPTTRMPRPARAPVRRPAGRRAARPTGRRPPRTAASSWRPARSATRRGWPTGSSPAWRATRGCRSPPP
jgi:PAS domain-containing protein